MVADPLTTARSAIERVADPEIPEISIVDLGIVRDVQILGEDGCCVSITPTYSGCPAYDVIQENIEKNLRAAGFTSVTVKRVLAPAWSTDWMSETARQTLRKIGIAPPNPVAVGDAGDDNPETPLRFVQDAQEQPVQCPRCGGGETRLVSRFGGTACKAQYQCTQCLEPFEYFKEI